VFEVFEKGFSWRDIILIAGGLFLVWKATREIHENVDPSHEVDGAKAVSITFASAIAQVLMLDLVFSIDSIITAVGMTDHLPIMIVAVVVAVGVMALASGPLAAFIHANPTIVMLALGFLLMIGTTLIADGFGFHVPKGYIYAAMAFSALVEGLNMLSRRARARRQADSAGRAEPEAGRRLEQVH
jgi:predicted tellurium resistance membrane protein TerC